MVGTTLHALRQLHDGDLSAETRCHACGNVVHHEWVASERAWRCEFCRALDRVSLPN